MLFAQCETLGEYISAWRIEIRTGFYHRAKKTRPVKELISSTAIRRGFMRIAIVLRGDNQCVIDKYSPKVSHWAKKTHHRHSAWFYAHCDYFTV